MHSDLYAADRVSAVPALLPLAIAAAPAARGLYEERIWRRPGRLDAAARIVASRWIDERRGARREQSVTPASHYVVSVALKSVQLRLSRGGVCLFEGGMPAGMMHVTAPGQQLEAEFLSPCDLIHLHIAADYVRARQMAAAGPAQPMVELADLMVRDALAAELARTLTAQDGADDPLYTESVGNMILMRLLALRPRAPVVCALPKWRLRRVLTYVEQNIAEPITLGDLAGAAGLSRMHFAAQFKAATGCRPHEHVLQQRIATAQTMMSTSNAALVEVALSVGFQTQSHFSTVFKRVTGQTPGRWRRTREALPPAGGRAIRIAASVAAER